MNAGWLRAAGAGRQCAPGAPSGVVGRPLRFTVRSHHLRSALALALVPVGCLASGQEPDPTQQTEQAELSIARSLDIDYRKCATVVLSDQIRELSKADTAYVSIMGEDPDKATLTSLRKVHPRTKRGSQLPEHQEDVRHSHTWFFYFGDLRATSEGEYMARTGFHCGSLCAAATEYRLKKDGDTCSVVFTRILWQS